jgi:hypothetical protein
VEGLCGDDDDDGDPLTLGFLRVATGRGSEANVYESAPPSFIRCAFTISPPRRSLCHATLVNVAKHLRRLEGLCLLSCVCTCSVDEPHHTGLGVTPLLVPIPPAWAAHQPH